MRRFRERKKSYRQSSIFPNWHRFHIEGPRTPRTGCSTAKLVALSHVAQHAIEDPTGCVYPCIVCTYTHTHTVASPKENQSFFFFSCRKIPPHFFFSKATNQTNPFNFKKLTSTHSPLNLCTPMLLLNLCCPPGVRLHCCWNRGCSVCCQCCAPHCCSRRLVGT